MWGGYRPTLDRQLFWWHMRGQPGGAAKYLCSPKRGLLQLWPIILHGLLVYQPNGYLLVMGNISLPGPSDPIMITHHGAAQWEVKVRHSLHENSQTLSQGDQGQKIYKSPNIHGILFWFRLFLGQVQIRLKSIHVLPYYRLKLNLCHPFLFSSQVSMSFYY